MDKIDVFKIILLSLDGKILPEGDILLIFAFGIHRNAKYFKDPEKFDPDRFSNFDSKFPYAYIPFSAGPRNCIGNFLSTI